MRDNLICIHSDGHSPVHTPMLLNDLPDGAHATVTRVVSSSKEVDAVSLRRLAELGFIPGEPVQLLRRGPGGREPLAVLIGDTMFGLRLLEAQCVEVSVEARAA
ncbi:Ferrous iron transporter FeoA domain-containing protein OS=Rhizobacter sp. Root404 OX=1736528 GN=ASC76_03630 PE=4 SV=1 [Rhizobacter fulvus]